MSPTALDVASIVLDVITVALVIWTSIRMARTRAVLRAVEANLAVIVAQNAGPDVVGGAAGGTPGELSPGR